MKKRKKRFFGGLPQPGHSELLWEDTFDTTFDLTKWEHASRPLTGTIQNFVDSYSYTENGLLRLKVDDTPSGGQNYSAGFASTYNLYTQQYGYFEAMAKFPSGNGIGTAFWMMDNSGVYEIDVMEGLGKDINKCYFYYNIWDTPPYYSDGGPHYLTDKDLTQEYHQYGVDWRSDHIYWYIDRVKYKKSYWRIPTNPMYLMLTIMVGDTGSFWDTPDGTTTFPSYFDIQYVRCYK